MTHGQGKHSLEDAEHAHHAGAHHFTRDVAMTMAMIAAGLAFVSLMSHR